MTPEQLTKLLTTRAQTWEAQKAILEDAAKAAGGEGRAFTPDERSTMDKQDKAIDDLTADINRGQLELKRTAEFAKIDEGQRVETPKGESVDETAEKEKRYGALFGKYLRSGLGEGSQLTGEEKRMLAERRSETRAQAEGTNAAGGYLVPQGYWLKITETLKAFGGLMAETNIITTSTGQPLPWPSNNDTGNTGHLLSENTQVAETDLTVGINELFAWIYTSDLVLASLALLQDSAFDLDTWLPTKLGQRLGRGIAADLVNGSGTARPLGVAVAPTTGVTGGTGSTTAALWSTGGTGNYGKAYNDLVNLVHSVDAAYRQLGNCKFLMNDLTLGAIRQIVDGNGRPLWAPAYPGGFMSSQTSGQGDSGQSDTILGYPVVIDNAMPVMAANAKSILFGDYKQGYVTRQVLDPTIMRLTERYADYLQVGFIGFERIDGRPDDPAAVRAFANSAT